MQRLVSPPRGRSGCRGWGRDSRGYGENLVKSADRYAASDQGRWRAEAAREQAVENGEMVVVNADGRLVRSDEVELGVTGRATGPAGKGGIDPPVDDTGHSSRRIQLRT